eukprot:155229-Prorocentrum_minimum.AAC.1
MRRPPAATDRPITYGLSLSNGPYLAPVKFLRLYVKFFADCCSSVCPTSQGTPPPAAPQTSANLAGRTRRGRGGAQGGIINSATAQRRVARVQSSFVGSSELARPRCAERTRTHSEGQVVTHEEPLATRHTREASTRNVQEASPMPIRVEAQHGHVN